MAIKDLVDRSAEARDDDHWIGVKPTLPQLIAFMTIGAIALIIAGVQPLLLGALVDEHRLSAAALGWSVTVEFLAMGGGVALANALFRPDRLQMRGLLAAAALVGMDLACTQVSGLAIVAARGVAGLAEGVLGWLVYLMLARASTPARLNGVFLTAQGVAQIAFAALLPLTLMKSQGANGGFVALAATAALAGLAVLVLPKSMAPLAAPARTETGTAAKFTAAGLASLGAVGLLYAFFIGFFAYFAQVAGQARLSPEQVGIAVAAALGASILGSGVAAALAKRVSYYGVYLVSLPAYLIVLATLATLPAEPLVMAMGVLFGFFWGLFMPFQLPLVIEADPSRRAAVLVPGMKALGAATGPLLCSFVVTDHDARGALAVGALCLITSFSIATALHLRRMRAARRGAPRPFLAG